MVRLAKLKSGGVAGLVVCEVTAVPYYELLHKDLDRACHINQVLFSQIVTGFYRRAALNAASLEILWQSVPVENQTYAAQVRQYILLRRIGSDAMSLTMALEQQAQELANELREKNFEIAFFSDEDSYAGFAAQLAGCRTDTVLGIGKKERYIQNVLMPSSLLYYNDVLEPSVDLNIAELTNALTRCPNSAISLQLIPTAYVDEELVGIEQGRTYMSYYISNMRFRQGIQADANTQAVADSYEYLLASEKEPLFYFHFLVYSDAGNAMSLANKVIAVTEEEGRVNGSALEIEDLSACGLSPAAQPEMQPWLHSNLLVFQQRNAAFWGRESAPRHFLRLRYLATARELAGIFKLPVDDGHTIGLDSRKISANREKLNQSIISESNFKVGRIMNASRSAAGQEAHAGVPLNDFTKHGLIVGMPGSGKTNFSLGLLLRFWKDFQIPFLAVEPTKSEYRSLLDAIPDLQVFTPGKNDVSPYIVNPFLPPRGVTVESFIPSLLSAFKAAFSMPNPLPDLFLSAINECYNAYGWQLSSTVDDCNAQPFGLYEFIRIFRRKIQNMDYKGEVKSNMESAGVVRLVSLIEQNPNIYDTIHSIPLEDLLRKPTVIELNAINNKELKALIMALLLIQICVFTKNNVDGDGKLKNILLIDEAHVLLAGRSTPEEGSADSQGSTVEALEDMIAEVRSFGTGIIIADQAPTAVGRNIVANTNVKVIFKLVEKENKDAIATATNMEDAEYERLGRLGVGEAMLHYGRVYAPLHIKTYDIGELTTIRAVIHDEEVRAHTHYWDTHGELLIPHRECACNDACAHSCDMVLRSNADFLAARLISKYLYTLPTKKAFVQFLVMLDPKIRAEAARLPNVQLSQRLVNCVKIKFLRKAMLAKNFGIQQDEYEMILKHPRFLHREEQPANKGGA